MSRYLRRTAIDSVMLRPAGKADAENRCVPRFALIEAQAPDLRAVILSPIILATLLSSMVVLTHLPGVTRAPLAEDVTLLVAPPEPLTMPDLPAMKAEGK